MLLGGLWHGAEWGYALWGAFHGIALAIERVLRSFVSPQNILPVKVLKAITVFTFVSFGWLFFKLPVISHVWIFIETIFQKKNQDFYIDSYILLYSAPVVVYHLFYLLKDRLKSFISQNVEAAMFAGMLFLIITNSGSPGAFIYFQF